MSKFFDRHVDFFSIPSFKHSLSAAFLCFAFIMPICGTLPLLGFLGFFQVSFTLIVLIGNKQQLRLLMQRCRQQSPRLSWLFVCWLILTSISYIIVMFETTLVWQMLGATARQSYILLQSFYVIAVAILLRTMGIRLMHVLLLMCLGLLVMFIFMIWLYQTEATHDSWIWFFNPLLIVHIRDLGNVAVAAALTLAVQFLFTQQTGIIKQGLYLFSLCIVCTFILWTGGRMAVFSSCFTLMLILVLAGLYKVISVQSALCIFLALIVSFYLVDLVAVFDWNGITRSSSTVSVVQQVATSGTGSLNQLSTGRWHMWSMSLKAMSESPIFGLGPYGYYFIPERTYGDQPHNLVVQFLVEWGIAGTFTVLMLLVGLAGKSLKALPQAFRSKDKDYIVSVSIVFALTLHALTGGTYFNVQPMYCLTLGFSGLCFSAYIAKPLGNKKSA